MLMLTPPDTWLIFRDVPMTNIRREQERIKLYSLLEGAMVVSFAVGFVDRMCQLSLSQALFFQLKSVPY